MFAQGIRAPHGSTILREAYPHAAASNLKRSSRNGIARSPQAASERRKNLPRSSRFWHRSAPAMSMARRLLSTAAWFGAFSRLMTVTHHLELTLLPHCHAIFRLPPHEKPSFIWPKLGDGTAFVSITYTHDEMSVVCERASLPASVAAQRGRRLFRVKGPLDFSLTGILPSLTTPLAEPGGSIFVISPYATAHLLFSYHDF